MKAAAHWRTITPFGPVQNDADRVLSFAQFTSSDRRRDQIPECDPKNYRSDGAMHGTGQT